MKKIIAVIFAVAAAALCLFSCAKKTELPESVCKFETEQIKEEQKFELKWECKDIEKINVKISHRDTVELERELSDDEIKAGKAEFDAYYGKHNVDLDIKLKNGEEYYKRTEASLSASEYVIAPVSGSMPQLYFTLNMKEITKDGAIPTFVWLDRPASWNWDKLPKNVFAVPTVDKKEILKHNNYDKMVEETDRYIEELFEVNKDSKFNLYINDFNSYLYVKMMVANGIPESNYYVTLMSDGGGSYADFNKAFDSDKQDFDADKVYDEMAKNLDKVYAQAREIGDYYNSPTFSVNTDVFRQYSYVAAREKDNVEWWVLRPRAGVLRSPDEEFINRVLNDDKKEGVIEERNFSAPLKAMTEDEKASLKEFYNFNGEMFEKAEKEGKKAMMILGSWATPENEPDFEAYVNLIKNYYGDEFVYYYKGHPNTPTSIMPDKQAQLEKLDLIDVESSINAELILFFYPDIYMCGYNSSTFLSVEKEEMACALFNMKKDDCKEEYKDLIGFFTSVIEDKENGEYASLCPAKQHKYLLAEFNRPAKNGADIGIYDADENTLTYYKSVDGKFEKIEK